MKDKYLDKYGNDSLIHLKIASKEGCNLFITDNKKMLKDREELEDRFCIKIRTPEEMKGFS